VKILYLGLPLGALTLLREGHQLVAACISRPSMPGMRRLRRLLAKTGSPLLGRPDLTQPGVRALLASTDPELVVSWFWTRRVPSTVLALAPHGGVNVHPSLLPRHRGTDPYFWTILEGDAETGVTAHWMNAQYDEGDILAQRHVPVPADVTAGQLARLLDRPTLVMLCEVVRAIERGEATAHPQNHTFASAAPRPSDDDCELVWDAPVEAVLRRIRAAAPDPGAFTGFGDDTVVILRARPSTHRLRGLDAGDVVRTPEGVVVVCGDGAVLLLEAQREADGKRFSGPDIAALFPGIASVGA
jgi:methionyl-tRNA formyltransferase